MKENEKKDFGCSYVQNLDDDNNCPEPPVNVKGVEIKEFTYSIGPKEKGLRKVTIEFKCADPFAIKEITFK